MRTSGTITRICAVLVAFCVSAGCTPGQETSPAPKKAGSQKASGLARSPIPPPPPRKESASISEALRDLPPTPELPAWGDNADAGGVHGVVTSVEASATEAGASILKQGGNAVDAAVATALALAVTHPSAGNLGGGGFLLLKVNDKVEAIDFRENSPAALTDRAFWGMIKAGGRGPASVGVPGTVAGLHLAHQRHGKLSWAQVVSPALKLALDGYILGARQAQTIAWSEQELRADPVAKEVFFANGKLPKVGALIKLPRLAKALERIRDQGRDGFYLGPTAEDLVKSLGGQGLLTLEDLKSYAAIIREPLYFDFAGTRVITMPAPSAGGVAVAQTLLMLNESGVARTKTGSAARYHLIAEASRRAQAERQLFVVAPDDLRPDERITQQKRALDPGTWLRNHPISEKEATRSSQLDDAFPRALSELEHTTHLSVIDGTGGLASLTVTLSGSFGSGVFSRETGIVLNNSSASFSSVGVNTPRPGKRTTSSMAPTLVVARNGRALVLGSPGGDTIPSTVTQTLLQLVLDAASLRDAVTSPRFHQTFAPGSLTMENKSPLPAPLQAELRALGHEITTRRSVIGAANIAALIDGMAYAVFDRREGGLALAAEVE